MVATPVRRLAIIGAECTGKTTLARALAASLPGCLVGEVLRDFVEQHGRTPHREEQAALMAEQQSREDAAALSCARPWLVVDPAPLLTAMYSRLYFDDPSLIPVAADAARRYALVVWCDIDVPWVPDGLQRDGPDVRDRGDAILADVAREELAPRGIRVVRVSGSVADRVATAGRAWQP